jgi:hypothetical protein
VFSLLPSLLEDCQSSLSESSGGGSSPPPPMAIRLFLLGPSRTGSNGALFLCDCDPASWWRTVCLLCRIGLHVSLGVGCWLRSTVAILVFWCWRSV